MITVPVLSWSTTVTQYTTHRPWHSCLRQVAASLINDWPSVCPKVAGIFGGKKLGHVFSNKETSPVSRQCQNNGACEGINIALSPLKRHSSSGGLPASIEVICAQGNILHRSVITHYSSHIFPNTVSTCKTHVMACLHYAPVQNRLHCSTNKQLFNRPTYDVL